MSYNPNQQWQPPVNPSNQQQQLQPFTQQATPVASTPGGGNYQQSQQSYSWTDGSTQGQHQATQQSWSWQGQSATPMVQSPPVISPPAMLMQGASHHQLHQQMHQNAISHSQQALAHHQQIMNQNMASFMRNVTTPMQQIPQPQITYQTMSPQPQPLYQQDLLHHSSQQAQIGYQAALPSSQAQSPLPTNNHQQYQQQLQYGLPSTPSAATQPQLQYPQNIYKQTQPQLRLDSRSQEVQSPQPQASQQGPLAQQSPQSPYSGHTSQGQQAIQQPPQQERQDDRYQNLEKQRMKDIEGMNRAGAEVNKRLRDLEQSKAQVQSDHEAKNQEVRRLQEQLAAVERQRHQDAERNSQQLAELVRSQAASPSAQTPAFDMSALQRVIRETQTQQLSAQDIERVIEEQVSKRLAGMATKADIQNAGAQMQNALSQVPAGLNEARVQQAVNRELNSVMQDVANRVNQQRRIAEQIQQSPQPRQTAPSRVQTEFVIEELPDEDGAPQHMSGNNSRPQRALPVAGTHGTVSAVVPSQTSQRPAAPGQSSSMSQYAAIEAGPLRVSDEAPQQAQMPTSSIPDRTGYMAIQAAPSSNNVQMPVISNRPQFAALEAPPISYTVPGNALAPANSFAPAVTADAGNALIPSPSGTQQQSVAQFQPQYATTQSPSTQLRQIEGTASQRQLEAPPSSSIGFATTGQELVHQSRDLQRRNPQK